MTTTVEGVLDVAVAAKWPHLVIDTAARTSRVGEDVTPLGEGELHQAIVDEAKRWAVELKRPVKVTVPTPDGPKELEVDGKGVVTVVFEPSQSAGKSKRKPRARKATPVQSVEDRSVAESAPARVVRGESAKPVPATEAVVRSCATDQAACVAEPVADPERKHDQDDDAALDMGDWLNPAVKAALAVLTARTPGHAEPEPVAETEAAKEMRAVQMAHAPGGEPVLLGGGNQGTWAESGVPGAAAVVAPTPVVVDAGGASGAIDMTGHAAVSPAIPEPSQRPAMRVQAGVTVPAPAYTPPSPIPVGVWSDAAWDVSEPDAFGVAPVGDGWVVMTANTKGGSGKTVDALGLAAELASRGLKVVVIDNDPTGKLATRLESAPAGMPTIMDAASALRANPGLDGGWLLSMLTWQPINQFYALPARRDSVVTDEKGQRRLVEATLDSGEFSMLVALAKKVFQVVILDCGNNDVDEQSWGAMTWADALVLAAEWTDASCSGVQQIMKTLTQMGLTGLVSRAVLASVGKPLSRAQKTNQKRLVAKCRECGVPWVTIPRCASLADGRIVLARQPGSVRKAFGELADLVCERFAASRSQVRRA